MTRQAGLVAFVAGGAIATALAFSATVAPPAGTTWAGGAVTSTASTSSTSPGSPTGAQAGSGTSASSPGSAGSSAASGSSSVESTTPEPSSTTVTLGEGHAADHSADQRRFYTQKVTWKACGTKKQPKDVCGTALVPLDHKKPAGATITIAMRKVPASNPKARKGTLFVNPGGPGGSGKEFAGWATDFFSDEVLAVYDVIGFDPRGIGDSSQGFQCFTDDDLDFFNSYDHTPETDAERKAIADEAHKRFAGCLKRGGQLALTMGTASVVADLDILREVVGDSRLNYLGVSYGSLIGAMYADEYTGRVGLMVLDSTVSSTGSTTYEHDEYSVNEEYRGWAYEVKGQFTDFVEACQDEDPCPLPKDVDAATKVITTWLNSLEKSPPRTGEWTLPRMTQGWAGTFLRNGLRERDSWPYLAEALDDALQRKDYSYMAYLAGILADKQEDGSYLEASYDRQHLPVICSDWAKETGDAVWPSETTRQIAGVWGNLVEPALVDCRLWTGPTRQYVRVSAYLDHPILVIGNTGDPVTPMSTTQDMAEDLIGSVLITVDADGHGAYGAGNDCADAFVDDYLVRGVAPTSEDFCTR